ncbi:MAG TPA: 3-hydroxyacyl-CoA dehydrogenase NAD-binding domain-containing protein [Microbacteriaceae bacterium]|nr:3-hydroxyacyl-CoA dehydrogenase NAD-binding domain-containing protein [Microbacteriaceae bacterium]
MSLPTTATVVGSGTMGPGIAATLKHAGVAVRVYDISREALARAEKSFGMAEKVLDGLGAGVAGGTIAFLDDLAAALDGTEYVIEAVPEKHDLKASVIAQIEGLVGDDVIIASNTSGIPISSLSPAMKHPGRLIGMHWSNPPHLIPMIEVIPGDQTDAAVVERVREVVKAFGYHPVLEKEIAGFIENRVLYAIMRECVALVQAGIATQEDVDTCVKWGIGYKLSVVGPMRLLDMAGLDIYQSVSSYLNKELDASTDTPQVVKDLIAEGKLGFKTEGGMYTYGPGDVDATRGAIVRGLITARKALETIDQV